MNLNKFFAFVLKVKRPVSRAQSAPLRSGLLGLSGISWIKFQIVDTRYDTRWCVVKRFRLQNDSGKWRMLAIGHNSGKLQCTSRRVWEIIRVTSSKRLWQSLWLDEQLVVSVYTSKDWHFSDMYLNFHLRIINKTYLLTYSIPSPLSASQNRISYGFLYPEFMLNVVQ